MAPAYAMPRDARPRRARAAGLRLLRDPRGVRGPGALHAGGLGGPGVLQGEARPSTSRWARSTAPSSTSTAARSPPATRSPPPAGGSSPALAKQLHEDGKGRGVISICAAGGQGVVAILESAGGAGHEPDRYAQIVNAPVVAALAEQLGLPQPVDARPPRAGGAGPRRSGALRRRPGGRLERPLKPPLDWIKVERAGAEGKAKALVFDATGIADSTELVELQRFFYPARRPPAAQRPRRRPRHPAGRGGLAPRPHRAAGARGLHPLARQGDRRPRRTAQLVSSPPAPRTSSTRPCASCSRRDPPTSPARWSGSARASRRFPRSTGSARWTARPRSSPAPRAGSAPRSPTTLARDGATVVGLDVPQAAADLAAVTAAIGGDAIELDITAADAPERIAERFADGVDVVVHNAGVTKDRTIAKMPEERWSAADGDQPLQRGADQRRPARAAACCAANGRIVCVSSMSGIAGNSGQTNYATSKAGVIGMVEALAPGAGRARGDDQRRRPRLHRDPDDGGDADRPARSRAGG